MLEALKNEYPREREHILSRVALSLMPNPGIYPKSEISKEDQLIHETILREIQPSGAIDKPRVFQRLSKEISNATFSQVREEDVKTRLGQKGLLREDYYKIELSDQFNKEFTRFGVRPTYAVEALRSPGAVEHLLPNHFGQSSDQPSFSLYLKTPPVRRSADSFSLMVLSMRKGAVQTVLNAWRVYHSDVNLSPPRRPLDVMIAFADRYGLPITVGSKTEKFILYEKFPVKGILSEVIKGPSGVKLSLNQLTQRIQFTVDPDISAECHVLSFIQVTKPPFLVDGMVIEISLAFMVDVEFADASTLPPLPPRAAFLYLVGLAIGWQPQSSDGLRAPIRGSRRHRSLPMSVP